MEYSKIETEIAARLNAYYALTQVVSNGEIVLFNTRVRAQEVAQDEKEANRPFQTGLVSVMFLKTVPGETSSLNLVRQEETHYLRLIFQARALRGVFGIYSVIDVTKRALIGYRPDQSTTKIVAESGPELKEFENNAQQYEMVVKFNALNTQAFDDEEQSQILLKKVDYEDGQIYLPGDTALY